MLIEAASIDIAMRAAYRPWLEITNQSAWTRFWELTTSDPVALQAEASVENLTRPTARVSCSPLRSSHQ